MNAAVLNLRQSYWRNGYRPVAITAGLKYPHQKEWPDLARQDPPDACRRYVPWMPGSGVLCDGLRPLDIDIEDAALVERVVKYALDHFGPAPVRYRCNSPRPLLLYRAADGSPPKAWCKNRATKNGVEVLGNGNQFFAAGKHPSGAVLHWMDGAPELTRRDELAAIDETQTAEFIEFCSDLIGADRVNHRDDAACTIPMLTDAPGSWHIGDIKAALGAIPNHFPDWEFWFRIAAAVYAASGGSGAGYQAWCAWSAQCPAHDGALAARTWQALRTCPTNDITAATLVWRATQEDAKWAKPSLGFTPLRLFQQQGV